MKIAAMSASTPPTAMPINRNGISTSHTIGYRIKATNATGQHNTSNMQNNRNLTIAFNASEPRGRMPSLQPNLMLI
jgi:hypothetical protein